MDILKEFNRANKYEQGNILFANGEFISSKTYQGFKLNLFRLDHYVFEVWYSPEQKSIEKIVRITDYDLLYTYFERIDISQLYGAAS
ncbi:hypothetical protein [Flexithrix dorotheae]|uniref:hypothetical protein n=1 Tax=Flexithrix dorotheae TaxID=70993 RepID=UPI000376A0E9|nr:hypothetical protein [Flexithrix dorotheae]